MDSDSALKLLGRYSRWQIKTYIIYSLGFGVLFAWMMMSVIFIGDTPAHRCNLPPNSTLNETIPKEVDWMGEMSDSKCNMYSNYSYSNETMPCTHGYWYDPASGYESTLVTEWDLVCGKNWMVEMSMTAGSIGNTIGLIVYPRLADTLGRKPIFLFCTWTHVLISLALAFVPTMNAYIGLTFLDGFQQQGIVSSAAVMAVELFPTEQRTFAGVAIEFFWVLGTISLTPFVYFIRNWRKVQLAITIPLFLTISFYWCIPESIPWLVANGRKRKAEKILRKAAEFSKVTLPDTIFEVDGSAKDDKLLGNEADENENKDGKQKKKSNPCLEFWKKVKKGGREEEPDPKFQYGVLDLFRTPAIRKYTITMVIIWFVNNLAYMALSLTVTSLAGNRYLNYFLYALVELPAYTVVYIALEKIGRIVPLFVFHVLAGVTLIATVIQTFEFAKNLTPLVITLSLLGKFAISGSYAIIYMNSIEIFPTNIRNTGFGLCCFSARLAGYIGPYFRILARYYAWMPQLILGLLAILAGGITFLLPETRYTLLPDTVEEVEEWEKQKKQKRKRKGRYDIDGNTKEMEAFMGNKEVPT